MKVLNFGSLNLDYVYHVDHFVKPGETLSAAAQTVNAGGKGLNQSIALSRSGVETYHAGCLGKGGEMLREMLEKSGVHTEYLKEVDALQGNAVIQVVPSGQNSILLFGGSNRAVTKEYVDEVLQHFESGDYLVLQNEISSLGYLASAAAKKGMKVILNPSPYNEAIHEVDFSRLSWLLVNEIEILQAAADQLGFTLDEEADGKPDLETIRKVCASFLEKYPDLHIIVTLGALGSAAFFLEDGAVKEVPQKAYMVKAVDTTAAGDTFTGYFISGLIQGAPIKESMDLAARASAVGVTRPGAAPSIPTPEEIREFF